MADNQKVVFVLGAGTGVDLNMPVGEGLKRQIAELLAIQEPGPSGSVVGDPQIARALASFASRDDNNYSVEQLFSTCHSIARSMPMAESIDQYIDMHPGNGVLEYCSKLAIVRSILVAESTSYPAKAFQDSVRASDLKLIEDTWFKQVFNIVCGGVVFEALSNRLLRFVFVNFNYDRCLEMCFFHAIQTVYRRSEKEVADVMRSLNVLHPYGTVGGLPWQEEVMTVDYGEKCSDEMLAELAGNIRTFVEQQQDLRLIQEVQDHISQSGMVVFLGFAFHDLNLALLVGERARAPFVIGSAYGLEVDELELVTATLKRMFNKGTGGGVVLRVTDCRGLLREFRRRILSTYGMHHVQFPG